MHSPSDTLNSANSEAANDPSPGLALTLVRPTLGICRFDPEDPVPDWSEESLFLTVSRSPDELSVVCEDRLVPSSVRCERGWRAIRVVEPLDFSLIGVLASLAQPLTEASVSIFSISTYDTDYLLVRQKNLAKAVAALEEVGHRFDEESHDLVRETRRKRRRRRRRRKPSVDTPSDTASTDAATSETDSSKTESSETATSETATSKTVTSETATSETAPKRRRTRRPAPPVADDPDLDWEAALDEEKNELETATAEAGRHPSRRRRGRSRRDEDSQRTPVLEAVPPVDEAQDEDAQSDDTRGTSRRRIVEEPPGDLEPLRRRRRRRRSRSPQREELSPWDGPSKDEEEAVATTEPSSVESAEAEPAAVEPAAAAVDTVAAVDTTATAEDPVDDSAPGAEKPAAAEQPVDDFDAEGDAVEADGLYTGAIPQHGVELTDTSFANLGISPPVLRTLDELGFERPTPIQAAVIPDALEGVDMIGLAETGSGKTGAFCLPLVERLTHGKGIRGLILCPTREIALQTKAFLDVFARDHSLTSVVVIGGVKMGPQINGLRRKPDIVVATPGRLADHLRRRNLNLNSLEEVVIDEADHMLDLGFLPQIQEILEQAPSDRRTMMFSATMPPPIERLAQRFMRDPLNVDIRPANQVAEGIEHRLYLVAEDSMKDCVLSLLREIEGSTLIFVRRKLYTEWLARQLHLAGLPVERIHSDRSQAQRVRALRGFREGKKRILVATDVAARGIDIPRIQHVINYGLPEMVEDYVHRAGRTARGNSVGVVSTLGTWRDKIMVRDIERVIGNKLPRCTAEGIEPWKELKQRKTVRRRRLL